MGDLMKFDLDQTVRIKCSSEVGEVIGRAVFTFSEPSYMLRYKSGDGRAIESWWYESALELVMEESGG